MIISHELLRILKTKTSRKHHDLAMGFLYVVVLVCCFISPLFKKVVTNQKEKKIVTKYNLISLSQLNSRICRYTTIPIEGKRLPSLIERHMAISGPTNP